MSDFEKSTDQTTTQGTNAADEGRLAQPIKPNEVGCPAPANSDKGQTLSVRTMSQNHDSTLLSQEVALNTVIRHQVQATGFEAYNNYINGLLKLLEKNDGVSGLTRNMINSLNQNDIGSADCRVGNDYGGLKRLHGTSAYEVLRLATEAFLLTRCGPTCGPKSQLDPSQPTTEEDSRRLEMNSNTYEKKVRDYLQRLDTQAGATPYLDVIIKQLSLTPPVEDPLTRMYASRFECPAMIELIWSYWHEEGMLSQTVNAIGIRFQNRRAQPGIDPLVNLETDPLRPLNNLLWGWIQTEYRRLSVQRRTYEYDHHYGLTLLGKAVPPLLSADSRSKFLESFHTLLSVADHFYEDSSNTTVIPDGFPLLNALRGTHLVLAEGAHNQYGDLPWTARVEMLIEQWMLSRQEMREFLRSRLMTPYHEAWMGQVDAMKKLQGWSDVSVTHYHELATCGESILLSVRHGLWAKNNDQNDAKSWAIYWRPEVQRYIYAYKAVTGVDLTLQPQDNTVPARLISQRLTQQRRQLGFAS